MSDKITRIFDFPYYQLKNTPLQKSYNFKKDGKWQSISTKNFIKEVNNGQEGESLESVKMSGSKLKELLASNDKKVSKAMEDNRESIKINETQLALEELGFTEFKDIDFEGKNENGQYEFSYE